MAEARAEATAAAGKVAGMAVEMVWETANLVPGVVNWDLEAADVAMVEGYLDYGASKRGNCSSTCTPK